MEHPQLDAKTAHVAIWKRNEEFLVNELSMELTELRHNLIPEGKFYRLRDFTAIVTLTGPAALHIAFSFDQGFMEKLFAAYAEGLDDDGEDPSLYYAEAAGDVINIVVGNATADIQVPGAALVLSPPIMIEGSNRIVRHRTSSIHMTDIRSPEGSMSIATMHLERSDSHRL